MGNAASLSDAPGEAQLRLVALGDALTELMISVDEATLTALSLQPGSCEEARGRAALPVMWRSPRRMRRGGVRVRRQADVGTQSVIAARADCARATRAEAEHQEHRRRAGCGQGAVPYKARRAQRRRVRAAARPTPAPRLTRRGRAGGSAARVIATLVALGDGAASASLIAVLGADTDGAAYRAAMKNAGVSQAATSSAPDAAHSPQWLALVEPDGRRTVVWSSGAAWLLSAAHTFTPGAAAALASAQLLHMDCWALRRDDAALAAVRAAAKAGAVICLDLGGPAAPSAVRECRAALKGLLATKAIELVFADEAAAAALGERKPRAGLSAADAGVALLLRYANVVVLTRGDKGSVTTRRNGTRFATPPAPGVAAAEGADAAGAGDAHAAGFLWALLHGAPLPVCAAAGALAAAEARAAPGAALTAAAIMRVRAATAPGGGAATAGAASVAARVQHGLSESLAEWLSPGLASTGEWPDDEAGAAPDGPHTELPSEKSTGHIWGDDVDAYDADAAADEKPAKPDMADAGAVFSAANTAAEQRLRASAGVETVDARGHAVLLRTSASGRTLTTHLDGSQAEECEAGERRHRRLSSRELDLGVSAAAELVAACADAATSAAASADVGSLAELFTGLGWLHDWVESRALFGAPQQAPARMRHSMSSTLAALELGDTQADHL
jgi:2-dehydro-3-deoxygluconokinase